MGPWSSHSSEVTGARPQEGCPRGLGARPARSFCCLHTGVEGKQGLATAPPPIPCSWSSSCLLQQVLQTPALCLLWLLSLHKPCGKT